MTRFPAPALFFTLLFGVAALVAAGPVSAEDGLGEMTGARRLEEALRKLDAPPEAPPRAKGFPIREFKVEGSSLYTPEVLNATLRQFIGPNRTVEDVEEARGYLQREFERIGYPTMIVTIPEQTIKDGVIRFKILEASVGKIEVTGNKHYSDEWILDNFQDIKPGRPLYTPDLTKALDRVNENPDHQVSPVLKPGAKPGTTDLNLKVKDKSPWHARLELNNTGTPDTPDLRATGNISYSNLWGREHRASVTVQTSPGDVDAVKVIGGVYTIPIRPWRHELALYGTWSDTSSTFALAGTTSAVALTSVGSTTIVGARYSLPIFPIARWRQRLSAGIEIKNSEKGLFLSSGASATPVFDAPVRYLPFNVGYEGGEADRWGDTRAYARLFVNFAGTIPRENFSIDFNNRRPGSTGNWAYGVLGIARTQRLWRDWSLRAILDGQIAGKPLIDEEQFGIGGATSVRGFMDRVVLGDEGFHASGELVTPDLGKYVWKDGKLDLQALAFVDAATAITILPNRQRFGQTTLASAGVGLRLGLWKKVFAKLDYGIPIHGKEFVEGLDQEGLRPVSFSVYSEF